jgi:hypothetical protein
VHESAEPRVADAGVVAVFGVHAGRSRRRPALYDREARVRLLDCGLDDLGVGPWRTGTADTETDDVVVLVYSGYHTGPADLPTGGQMGEADLWAGQPTGDVSVNGGGDKLRISAGQCFTIEVMADNHSDELPADVVHFTLNW